MAKKGKPGVMIYFETARAIKRCSYEEKGRLFDAILEYAEFGVVPELPPPLDMAWAFIVDAHVMRLLNFICRLSVLPPPLCVWYRTYNKRC